MHAAEEGHTNCVRFLLEAGANTDARDFVRNLMLQSCVLYVWCVFYAVKSFRLSNISNIGIHFVWIVFMFCLFELFLIMFAGNFSTSLIFLGVPFR